MKLPARDLLAIPLVVFTGVFLAEVTVMEWLEGSSVLDVRSEYSAYLDGALMGLVAAVVYWASRGAWTIGRDGRPWIANAVILAFVAATYEIAVHQAVTDPHLSLNPLALSVLNGVLVAGVAGGCAAWLMFIDRRVDAANDDPAHKECKGRRELHCGGRLRGRLRCERAGGHGVARNAGLGPGDLERADR